MSWPVDKLQLVQESCRLTGDNPPTVANDGSEEWDHGSAAYEMALPYAIEGKNWKFGTTVAVVAPSPTVPADTAFDTAYAKPSDLLHLIWVRINDADVLYQILDNQIVVDGANGQSAQLKYVRAPSVEQVTPTFAMAMRCFVMSGLYRGLHENITEADKMWALGESMLRTGATRSDQEEPRRQFFKSRVTAARFGRVGWGR